MNDQAFSVQQFLRTHTRLVRCSLVLVALTIAAELASKFYPIMPPLDKVVGTIMDKTVIGTFMNWLVNKVEHTQGILLEFRTVPGIGLPMLQLVLALSWIVLVVGWIYLLKVDDGSGATSAKKNGAPAF
jgi:hypothetical protein